VRYDLAGAEQFVTNGVPCGVGGCACPIARDVQLAASRPVKPEVACTNDCHWPKDGECDDGGPGFKFSICDLGTDCEDCTPGSKRGPEVLLCTNECSWDGDTDCDDGGPGAQYALCAHGTDCQDCGARREMSTDALGFVRSYERVAHQDYKSACTADKCIDDKTEDECSCDDCDCSCASSSVSMCRSTPLKDAGLTLDFGPGTKNYIREIVITSRDPNVAAQLDNLELWFGNVQSEVCTAHLDRANEPTFASETLECSGKAKGACTNPNGGFYTDECVWQESKAFVPEVGSGQSTAPGFREALDWLQCWHPDSFSEALQDCPEWRDTPCKRIVASPKESKKCRQAYRFVQLRLPGTEQSFSLHEVQAFGWEVDPDCNDVCYLSNDGHCDDGGYGSTHGLCDEGTDCSDCGTLEGRERRAPASKKMALPPPPPPGPRGR